MGGANINWPRRRHHDMVTDDQEKAIRRGGNHQADKNTNRTPHNDHRLRRRKKVRNREPYANYKALSSIARTLLPEAEKMHSEGMSWRQIAQDLRVSKSSLHIWRTLRQTEQDLGKGKEIR